MPNESNSTAHLQCGKPCLKPPYPLLNPEVAQRTWTCPSSSLTSGYCAHLASSSIPPIALDKDGDEILVKIRPQYIFDRELRSRRETALNNPYQEPVHSEQQHVYHLRPLRKQVAFVKEEEFKCLLVDRVGTLHISELQFDFDIAPLTKAEEMATAGGCDVLLAAQRKSEDKAISFCKHLSNDKICEYVACSL